MNPCVYATQHPIWLDAALACDPSKLICFRSNRRWATAAKLLANYGDIPILFRKQEDSESELACRYVAELVEIHFRMAFGDEDQQLDWLDEKLWLQRETIKGLKSNDPFSTWEDQYQTWEIDNFMKCETWYMIKNLCEIKPLPLPLLKKLDGDHPLAPNYIRGYALCHYPTSKVKIVDSAAVV